MQKFKKHSTLGNWRLSSESEEASLISDAHYKKYAKWIF